MKQFDKCSVSDMHIGRVDYSVWAQWCDEKEEWRLGKAIWRKGVMSWLILGNIGYYKKHNKVEKKNKEKGAKTEYKCEKREENTQTPANSLVSLELELAW